MSNQVPTNDASSPRFQFYRVPRGESRVQPAPGWNYGNLDLMGGKILVQFTPLDGSGLISRLGRNGTCLSEVRRVVKDLSVPDLRRTVRTLLR